MSGFLNALRVLYVDHVAVTTPAFEETVRDYLATSGARIFKGPGFNASQNVRYAFVRLADGMVVEVLGLPDDGQGPIAHHVQRGGGAYHICYAVADIEASIAAAVGVGARLVVPPKADPAHDGRPVAFLIHPAHGVVELVAAYPSEYAVAARLATETPASAISAASPSESASGGEDKTKIIRRELLVVFRKILAKAPPDALEGAALGVTEGWDSLAQLQIVMGVEKAFGVRVPMRDIERLASFEAYVAYLSAMGI